MVALSELDPETEVAVARLARTAYDAALRHGIRGSFVDLELELWYSLRAAFENGSSGDTE